MKFELIVSAPTAADRDRYTTELEVAAKSFAPDVAVQRTKTSQNSMDLGTTIQIVAGSAAATAIAKGIAMWLAKRQSATLDYVDGSVRASGLTSKDTVKLVEILTDAANRH